MGKILPRGLPELHNFLNPDQDVDDSEPKHRAFQERVDHDRAELRVKIEKVIVVPYGAPGQKQEKDTYFQGVQDIDDVPNPRSGEPHT